MSAADKVKATAAAIIAAVGLYYSLIAMVTSPAPARAAVFIATVLAAGGLFYLSEPGRRLFAYAQASAVEIRKVVWPDREEVLKMSAIVLLFVTVVAIFLWIVDSILAWLLQFLAL